MFPVPTSYFLTKGVGVHRERLTAFELALRDADIEQQNLVTVSSILPPRCEQIERERGVVTLRPGEITFCVMARTETDEPGRRIHSSIGLARPADPAMYGYISEHHGYGMTADESGDYAEDLAATMLASTLGHRIRSQRGLERAQACLSSPATSSSTAPPSPPPPKATPRASGPARSPRRCSASRRHRNVDHADIRAAAELPRDRAPRPPTPRSALPAFRSTSAPPTVAGARFGPAAIRQASRMLVDGDHPQRWIDPAALPVADIGDFRIALGDILPSLALIEEQAAALKHLVALGGDHTHHAAAAARRSPSSTDARSRWCISTRMSTPGRTISASATPTARCSSTPSRRG